MKYCEKCGNKMDDDSIFCSKCGRKFVLIEDEDNNSGTILTNNMISDDSTNRISVAKNKTKLNKRIFAIVIFAVIAVLVTFGSVWIVYLFFGPQETPESVAEFKASCSYYEYDMIARRPKDYEGKHAVIDGKVLQVVSENNSLYQLRVGEINDTDRVYYVEYKTKNDDENRILKNDKIRFYGIFRGLVDVETIFGEKKSGPAFEAKYIEFLDSAVVSNQSSIPTTSQSDESVQVSITEVVSFPTSESEMAGTKESVSSFVQESNVSRAKEPNQGFNDSSEDSLKIYIAEISVRNYGRIVVKLNQKAAPKTVKNFVDLANSGFYDGLTFHRIMNGFMMQGGDPLGNGTGGSENTIYGEFSENGFENKLSHTRGAISMARDNFDMNSASSQFFIVQGSEVASSLDGKYACFGYVTEGLDVVDKICADSEPIDDNGTIPTDQQPVIESIIISEN